MMMKESDIEAIMFAPCGMNCKVCCKIKDCVKARDLSYCYACSDYPCKLIKNLENSYKKRYQASLMENSEIVKNQGLEVFMEQQKKKYTCSTCGGVISIHDKACSDCQEKAFPTEKGWV